MDLEYSMGRIEEALRKAKANRQDNFGRAVMDGSHMQRDSALRANKESGESEVSQILASHIIRVDSEQLLEQRVIAASDQDERVGPYRQLRTLLLKTMQDNQWTTLAITSPNEGAGKSLTASNLAISMSRVVDTTVLLVDLNLKTPSIHEKLGLVPEKGLVDFLEGQAELEEILFDPGLSRLTVLTGRSSGKNSSELLASPKMQNLMQELYKQKEANIIIYDLPAILRNDDAILFAPYTDATLVVVEDGVTTEDQLQQAMRLLDKANVIGTVLNKAKY